MENSSILNNYKELFKNAYTENNTLEAETTTDQDIEVLMDLDPDEVYDNLKDLVHNLLDFKRAFKTSHEGELVNTLQEFENASKELEAEMETCTKENEFLKLEIEELKKKIDGLDNKNSLMEARLAQQEDVFKRENTKKDTKKEFFVKLPVKTESENTGESNGKGNLERNSFSPHKRGNSFTTANNTPQQKRTTIKSVKFEYFVSSCKKDEKNPIRVSSKMLTEFGSPGMKKTKRSSHSKSNSELPASIRQR